MFKSLHFVYWTFPTQPSLRIVVYSYSKSPSLLSGCCIALYFVLPLLREKKKSWALHFSSSLIGCVWLWMFCVGRANEASKHYAFSQHDLPSETFTFVARSFVAFCSFAEGLHSTLGGLRHEHLKKHSAHVQSLHWAKALHCIVKYGTKPAKNVSVLYECWCAN